jgi:hypothetical protein
MKIENVIWAFMMLIAGLGPGWCAVGLGVREHSIPEIGVGLFMIAIGVISCIGFLLLEWGNNRR